MATRSSSRLKCFPANANSNSEATKRENKMPKARQLVNVENPSPIKHRQQDIPTQVQSGSEDDAAQKAQRITAFLRIRPQGSKDGKDTSEVNALPYLIPISDTTVRMTSMEDVKSKYGPSDVEYTFSHVFQPETSQEAFFEQTTIPLVKDLLNGQNGLLFAYGVTNSGKTYSIQGNGSQGAAGILPRTLDVLFNSVGDSEFVKRYRPVRLSGVQELKKDQFVSNGLEWHEAVASSFLDTVWTDRLISLGLDNTVVPVDQDYEYSIWISYAEIYNERIFDLLATVETPDATSNTVPHKPHAFGRNMNDTAGPGSDLNRNPYLVRRKALALKTDPHGGKYVAGLKEVHCRTSEDAKRVLCLGQLNRKVFGTLANQASSRSHAVFTIKLMRISKHADVNADSIRTCRLSIVDLAGSERSRNTQNTGERLREAGNINRSLMVLGQCLEVLRANQRKASAPGSGLPESRLAIVPFRDSKLTELFQDFFLGSGKVTMIVNVNPYDTGFDENSRVMKFSALAREVSTVATKKVVTLERRRTVQLSLHGNSLSPMQGSTIFEVVEEDPDHDDDDDCGPINPLVDALFDEIESLRRRLHDSDMRLAVIEAEVREEVMQEMEDTIRVLERTYDERLAAEIKYNEEKLDRKIDMLHRSGLLARPGRDTRGRTSISEPSTSATASDGKFEETESHVLINSVTPRLFSANTGSVPSREFMQHRSGDIGLFEHDEESAAETADSVSSLEDVEHTTDTDGETDGDQDYFSDHSYVDEASEEVTGCSTAATDSKRIPSWYDKTPRKLGGQTLPVKKATTPLEDDFDSMSLSPVDELVVSPMRKKIRPIIDSP